MTEWVPMQKERPTEAGGDRGYLPPLDGLRGVAQRTGSAMMASRLENDLDASSLGTKRK